MRKLLLVFLALTFGAAHASNEEAPRPPWLNVEVLKAAIAIMSILLVGGTVVVIGTIIYRAMTYQSKSASTIPAQKAEKLQGFSKLDVEVERGTNAKVRVFCEFAGQDLRRRRRASGVGAHAGADNPGQYLLLLHHTRGSHLDCGCLF